MVVIVAVLFLPFLVWCIYAAANRQVSLKSIFVLIGAECLLLASLVKIFGR